MILHIVNKSPFQHSALQNCLRTLGPQDSILLIEDGVLLLANPSVHTGLPQAARLFALQDDCVARGLNVDNRVVTAASFQDFVELVARHEKSVSWV